MKALVSFFARREVNMTTQFARQRMSKSMPGEYAAMESFRLLGISL